MAHTQLDARPPFKAASAMGAYLPITLQLGASVGASPLAETIRLAASVNMFPLGLTLATVVTAGDPVQWYTTGDTAKGIAGASLGAGALVGVGSTNGVLAAVLPVDAGPTGLPRYAVGVLLKNAAAGDVIPVFIAPQQVV